MRRQCLRALPGASLALRAAARAAPLVVKPLDSLCPRARPLRRVRRGLRPYVLPGVDPPLMQLQRTYGATLPPASALNPLDRARLVRLSFSARRASRVFAPVRRAFRARPILPPRWSQRDFRGARRPSARRRHRGPRRPWRPSQPPLLECRARTAPWPNSRRNRAISNWRSLLSGLPGAASHLQDLNGLIYRPGMFAFWPNACDTFARDTPGCCAWRAASCLNSFGNLLNSLGHLRFHLRTYRKCPDERGKPRRQW